MGHTKGKWNIRGNTIFIDDTYKSVATVHVVKNYQDITFKPIEDVEAVANAKLMAAAPDLLDACRWAIEQFKKLAAEGLYPEAMLTKNGGEGIMPLINAVQQATE